MKGTSLRFWLLTAVGVDAVRGSGYHRYTMAEAEKIPQAWGWATPKALVSSMRPRQWTKNLIIYFAFFFTVGQGWQLEDTGEAARLFARTTIAFVLFCLATSAVYLINDVLDAEKDRHHPEKRHRPIAARTLATSLALVLAFLLAAGSIALAVVLKPMFALVVLVYFAVMVAYSTYLKRMVVIDVMTISAGFVLRAVAGAVILDVSISPWLYICTSLGALFLGFAKRLNEAVLTGEDGGLQRETLDDYNPRFLEQLIAIVAPATLVSYILYTFTSENLPDNHAMMLTIPFVMYGLFRYLYLVHNKNLGESPEEILLTDKPLMLNIALWLTSASAVLVVYR